MVLAVIKQVGGGAVMWLGAIAIPLIYKSMFSKNVNKSNEQSRDVKLNKDKDSDNHITLKK
jgi:hypothetical protein